jgi:hypothetical protein
MVLPVLFIRDYGWPGFIVFAVPNVLGAAAMGFVLRSAMQSELITRDHDTACWWFSLVTIAFHLYVAAWLLPKLIGGYSSWLVLAAVLFFVIHHRPLRETLAGLVVWLISLGLFAYFLTTGAARPIPPTGAKPASDLLALALVCAFGFALCPYLDLTFHRARQHTSKSGARIAFGIGFCVVFFSMILFTAVYAPHLLAIMGGEMLPTWVRVTIGVHMLIQIALTLAYHYQAIEPELMQGRRIVPFVVALILSQLLGGFIAYAPSMFGITAPEIVYRCIMGAYALLFPEYVYLRMLPRRRASMTVYWTACAAALPFFGAGLIAGKMLWITPGLIIALGAALFAKPTNNREISASQLAA